MSVATYSTSDIRAWAKQKGYKISDKGRLPKDIVAAFRMEKGARKVVGNRPGKQTKINSPKCPVHHNPMDFSAALGMWTCPVAEEKTGKLCKFRAWPKDGGTKPLIGSGKVTIVRDKNRAYLRSDNGVLMDITTYMLSGPDIERGPGGSLIATIELTLRME